ncbi:MAG TPA: hypothetical protein VL854_03035 [Nitrososphaeraceae archaeon]|nr:hypothetical protein [Nitrososphaeraceae archaeon]
MRKNDSNQLTKVELGLSNGALANYYFWPGARMSQFLDRNGISEETNASGIATSELFKAVQSAYVKQHYNKLEAVSTGKAQVAWVGKDKQFVLKGSVTYKLGLASRAQALTYISKRVELSERSINAMKEALERIEGEEEEN